MSAGHARGGELRRVLIAGGGTGGHVFPAIAVAQKLRAELPDSEVLFVGSERGLERELVPAHGFSIELLRVGRLKGMGRLARLRTVVGLLPALWRSAQLVRRFSPEVVVGVGGYASAPVTAAAALWRVPVVLLEQNAIAGLTNRLLARFARRVVVSFPDTVQTFSPGKAIHLGNPLRPQLVEALHRPRSEPDRGPGLLVLGGSQGAHRLNELVTEAAPRLRARFARLRIVHQTGARDVEMVAQRYADAGIDAEVQPFIDDVASAYRASDLVVARSGATTLAELTVAGLPALFVPYPHAADDHQAANADYAVRAGGARMIREQQLDAARLASELGELLADRDRLARMREAMRSCGRPNAAADVVTLLREVSRGASI